MLKRITKNPITSIVGAIVICSGVAMLWLSVLDAVSFTVMASVGVGLLMAKDAKRNDAS